MKPNETPFFTQPLVRLKRHGPELLHDAELLALLLASGAKEKNALDLANNLLKKHNFHRLAEMNVTELKEEIGNERTAAQLVSMFEILRRTNKLKRGGFNAVYVNSPQDVFNRFVDRCGVLKKEVFWVVLLDTKNKIIGEKEIFVGGLNASLIHPREIFNYAIRESANAIVAVHNHPSGDPTPSQQDNEVTRMLKKVSNTVGIKLADHVIIGKDRYYSYKSKS